MSQRGFAGVREAAESINQRKNGGEGGGERAFFLSLPKTGDHAIVRFLEQGEEIFWAWSHEIPRQDRSWGDWTPCLDQSGDAGGCPGCEYDLNRRFKGYINLVWRDAPVYKRNSEGRLEKDENNKRIVVDHKDQVAIWNQGIQVFEELDDKDQTYKGLSSRDFKITRKGEGKNTRYSIDPADPDGGPKGMSEDDKKLNETKYDLNEYTTPLPVEKFIEKIGKVPGGTEPTGSARPNPFLTER